MEITDSHLIKAHLAGEKGAFDILVARYLRAVHAVAFHYAKNRADAEDIAQETFLKVWRHLQRFDTDKNFKPWVLQITKNQALDHLKKKRPMTFSSIEQEDVDLLDLIPDTSPLPDALARRAEEIGGLRETLDGLPASDRKLLFFRYMKGFSFKEIAEELGEVLDTVKSRHRRLLLKLRKELLNAAPWS